MGYMPEAVSAMKSRWTAVPVVAMVLVLSGCQDGWRVVVENPCDVGASVALTFEGWNDWVVRAEVSPGGRREVAAIGEPEYLDSYRAEVRFGDAVHAERGDVMDMTHVRGDGLVYTIPIEWCPA